MLSWVIHEAKLIFTDWRSWKNCERCQFCSSSGWFNHCKNTVIDTKLQEISCIDKGHNNLIVCDIYFYTFAIKTTISSDEYKGLRSFYPDLHFFHLYQPHYRTTYGILSGNYCTLYTSFSFLMSCHGNSIWVY